MPSPFCRMDTADIYRMVRPYKELLGLERLNQKTIEQFLGLRRKDRYDGGQLIWIYRAYRDGRSEDPKGDLEKLLLHNYEDVLGMLSLTMLTAYPAFFQMVKDSEINSEKNGEKDGGSEEREIRRDLPAVDVRRCSCPVGLSTANLSDGAGKDDVEQAEGEMCAEELRLSLRMPVPVPVPVSGEAVGYYSLELYGTKAEIHIPLRERTLFHFFPDIKTIIIFLLRTGLFISLSDSLWTAGSGNRQRQRTAISGYAESFSHVRLRLQTGRGRERAGRLKTLWYFWRAERIKPGGFS